MVGTSDWMVWMTLWFTLAEVKQTTSSPSSRSNSNTLERWKTCFPKPPLLITISTPRNDERTTTEVGAKLFILSPSASWPRALKLDEFFISSLYKLSCLIFFCKSFIYFSAWWIWSDIARFPCNSRKGKCIYPNETHKIYAEGEINRDILGHNWTIIINHIQRN